MIDANTIRNIQILVPNYHTVDKQFVKDTFSCCVCGRCRFCNTNKVKARTVSLCGRLCGVVPDGLAIVSQFGTCDAAKFKKENQEFELE